jgi:hypothetical protein
MHYRDRRPCTTTAVHGSQVLRLHETWRSIWEAYPMRMRRWKGTASVTPVITLRMAGIPGGGAHQESGHLFVTVLQFLSLVIGTASPELTKHFFFMNMLPHTGIEIRPVPSYTPINGHGVLAVPLLTVPVEYWGANSALFYLTVGMSQ